MSAGIFITQQGVSVPTAADYQFVFNSNWPSLQVAFDTTVTIAANATLTIPHNLNFTPFTVGWILQNGISIGRIFAYAQRFISAPQSTVSFTFDSTNVYLTGDTTNSYEVNIKCYNLDITTSVDYTFPQYPKYPTLYDNTTGIKVTKSGKQINSTDLRDFILHSRAQSPAVLSVVPSTLTTYFNGYSNVTSNVAYYANPVTNAVLGNATVTYIPWTYAFMNNGNNIYYPIAPGNQQSGGIFLLLANIYGYQGVTANGPGAIASIGNDSTTSCSLVVLRDPLLSANNVVFNYTTGTPVGV